MQQHLLHWICLANFALKSAKLYQIFFKIERPQIYKIYMLYHYKGMCTIALQNNMGNEIS